MLETKTADYIPVVCVSSCSVQEDRNPQLYRCKNLKILVSIIIN